MSAPRLSQVSRLNPNILLILLFAERFLCENHTYKNGNTTAHFRRVIVKAGQVLVVQKKTMKIQMRSRASFAGRGARVPVGIGAQVEKGVVLVKVVEGIEG